MGTHGLSYEEERDERVVPDPEDDRIGAFKAGWTRAENDHAFVTGTLDTFAWHNLGWRLGRLFGETRTGTDPTARAPKERGSPSACRRQVPPGLRDRARRY